MNLSTQQIFDFLHKHDKTKAVFLDCVPCDLIPASDSYPYAVVVNTEPAGKEGKHWVAIYVVSPTVVEYFDSSGQKPTGPIKEYVDRFPTARDNDKPIQSSVTNVCGAHCVYFIVKRCKGHSFSEIVRALLKHPEADLLSCLSFYGLIKH